MKRLNSSPFSPVWVIIQKCCSSKLTILKLSIILVVQFAPSNFSHNVETKDKILQVTWINMNHFLNENMCHYNSFQFFNVNVNQLYEVSETCLHLDIIKL